MKGVSAFVGALFLIPATAGAQVVISEIMYDLQVGSDSGREWIEVFNASSNAIRLIDWRLYEANANHAITAFAGGDELPSGSYAIIADSPSKFMDDWPSYTGALFDSAFSLSNSGETIAIHTPAPEFRETDSIAFQSTWGAAGDGNTLQRTSTETNAFAAAAPTPGTGTLALIPGLHYTPSVEEVASSQTSTTSSAAKSEPTPSYVPPPLPQLFADGGADRTVIVGADTEFNGRAYNRDDVFVEKTRFLWNFGDGSTAEGPAVLHHFDYPGRYAVILTAAADKEAMIDRIIVTAEPAQLAFMVNADGSVTIENRAGRDLDLSRWIVRSFLQTFTLPEHSIVLSGESMRIPKQNLKFIAGLQTELAYPNGVMALGANQSNASPAATPTAAAAASVSPPAVPPAPRVVRTIVAPQVAEASTEAIPDETEATTSAALLQSAAAAAAPRTGMWWFALAALLLIGGGTVAYVRHLKGSEWDIEEG